MLLLSSWWEWHPDGSKWLFPHHYCCSQLDLLKPRLWPWRSLVRLKGPPFLPLKDWQHMFQPPFIRSHHPHFQFIPAVSCWSGWLVLWFTPTWISLSNGQSSIPWVLSSEHTFSFFGNVDRLRSLSSVSFHLTILSSIYFSHTAFCYKQSGGTKPVELNFNTLLRNFPT